MLVGRTYRDVHVTRGSRESLRMLHILGTYQVNVQAITPLHNAVCSGNLCMVHLLILDGALDTSIEELSELLTVALEQLIRDGTVCRKAARERTFNQLVQGITDMRERPDLQGVMHKAFRVAMQNEDLQKMRVFRTLERIMPLSELSPRTIVRLVGGGPAGEEHSPGPLCAMIAERWLESMARCKREDPAWIPRDEDYFGWSRNAVDCGITMALGKLVVARLVL